VTGSGDNAYAANLLGALALTLTDRMAAATGMVAEYGPSAASALVTLLGYPGRPTDALASTLGLTHPGAVLLVNRLQDAGLVDRAVGDDKRVRLLSLTAEGRLRAQKVLEVRRAVLTAALEVVDAGLRDSVTVALEAMLGALTVDRRTADRTCRLCDEQGCPDERCPVENAPLLLASETR
jgi:MarR family transcriptional regulator, negative regulator of the multidrug operon emrRAB